VAVIGIFVLATRYGGIRLIKNTMYSITAMKSTDQIVTTAKRAETTISATLAAPVVS
jgi:hypothetical protein